VARPGSNRAVDQFPFLDLAHKQLDLMQDPAVAIVLWSLGKLVNACVLAAQ
jgi:hypothetical protein